MSHFNQEIYGMQKRDDTKLWFVLIVAIILAIFFFTEKYARDNYAELVELREMHQ